MQAKRIQALHPETQAYISALERVAEAARKVHGCVYQRLPYAWPERFLEEQELALRALDALKDSGANEGKTAGRAQYNPSIAERRERFQNTTGALGYMTKTGPTGANHHPDRCVCQLDDPTPHKHYDEPPFACARCTECEAYCPALDALKDSGPSSEDIHNAFERARIDRAIAYGANPNDPALKPQPYAAKADEATVDALVTRSQAGLKENRFLTRAELARIARAAELRMQKLAGYAREGGAMKALADALGNCKELGES